MMRSSGVLQTACVITDTRQMPFQVMHVCRLLARAGLLPVVHQSHGTDTAAGYI
jgi:hypothetical protein